jgi:long-subunit fatty acid transport protein
LTGSAALVLGKIGLISFEYSRKDFSSTKFRPVKDNYFATQNTIISNALTSSQTYRLGSELRFERISVRGGYSIIESPYLNKAIMDDTSTLSLGLGYNFGNTRLDLSYSTFDQNRTNQLYMVGAEDIAPLAKVSGAHNNILLTLGFSL